MLKVNFLNDKVIDEERPVTIDIDGLSMRDIASSLPSEFESVIDQISRVVTDSRTLNNIKSSILKQLNRVLEVEGRTIEVIVSNLRKMSNADDIASRTIDNDQKKNAFKIGAILKHRIDQKNRVSEESSSTSNTNDDVFGSTYEDGMTDTESLEGDD